MGGLQHPVLVSYNGGNYSLNISDFQHEGRGMTILHNPGGGGGGGGGGVGSLLHLNVEMK